MLRNSELKHLCLDEGKGYQGQHLGPQIEEAEEFRAELLVWVGQGDWVEQKSRMVLSTGLWNQPGFQYPFYPLLAV